MTQRESQMDAMPAYPLRFAPICDARGTLSVQVHPADRQTGFLPPGESGKTEAWVVLEAGPDSRVYAGLKPGTTGGGLRRAIANRTVPDLLASFKPKAGDGIFIPAGTVHSLGDLVVFEVQENRDVTFRLYDWDHVDPKTGRGRPLQIEQAMACSRRGGDAPGSGLRRRKRPVGPRRRLLCCGQRRRSASAGGGGSMLMLQSWHDHVAGAFPSGGRLTHEKAHRI